MELPPAEASEVRSSAVSPSAELLSSEIKTFVNFIARQWCWMTTWEEKQGTVSCLGSPALALHPSTDWAFTSELALQACRHSVVQQQLCPDRRAKRVPYIAQGCHHVTEL